jgi:hypothetical protein
MHFASERPSLFALRIYAAWIANFFVPQSIYEHRHSKSFGMLDAPDAVRVAYAAEEVCGALVASCERRQAQL